MPLGLWSNAEKSAQKIGATVKRKGRNDVRKEKRKRQRWQEEVAHQIAFESGLVATVERVGLTARRGSHAVAVRARSAKATPHAGPPKRHVIARQERRKGQSASVGKNRDEIWNRYLLLWRLLRR